MSQSLVGAILLLIAIVLAVIGCVFLGREWGRQEVTAMFESLHRADEHEYSHRNRIG